MILREVPSYGEEMVLPIVLKNICVVWVNINNPPMDFSLVAQLISYGFLIWDYPLYVAWFDLSWPLHSLLVKAML